MSSTDRVMALLAEANPIPDVAALQRPSRFESGDFTTLRLPAPQERPDAPRRVRWALVAAAVVVLAALAIVVGTRSTTDPVETIPAPTVPATPEPTTGPTPTAAPTAEPSLQEMIEGAWEAVSYGLVFTGDRYAVTAVDLAFDSGTYVVDGGELVLVSDASSASCPPGSEARFVAALIDGDLELEPIGDDDCGFDRGMGVGTRTLSPSETAGIPPSALDVARPLRQLAGPGLYVSERFTPGFSVVLQRGWSFHAAPLSPDVDFTTSINDRDTLVVWYRHEVETADAVHDLFSAHPSVQAGGPQPTSIAGVDGITFDYRSPEPNNLLTAPGIGAGSIVGPPENVWRVWALDVDGVVVTVVASFDPETVAEKSAEVEQLLRSISWAD